MKLKIFYDEKNASFKMSLLILLMMFVTNSEANAARIESWNKPCLQDFAVWKKRKGFKAFAVTKVYPNGQGCGMSWSWSSSASARNDALRRCHLKLKKNRPQTRDKCTIVKSSP